MKNNTRLSNSEKQADEHQKIDDSSQRLHQCSGSFEEISQGQKDYDLIPPVWKKEKPFPGRDDLAEDLARFSSEGGAVPPDNNGNGY